MLAVRSRANADLFNWPDASWVKFVGIRTTRIYYQLKIYLNMLKTYSLRILHQMAPVLAPAVNYVIFMVQSPNIAVLRVREKFTKILSDQLTGDGCWEMKNWLDQKILQLCERLGFY